mmetsp:Transcript_57661/g.135727  ORF Transcript_57661/g.135727 Transcript_57661/m.135727 type:complete len:325 (+) Transcript_57661:3863-4837(+)
MQIPERHRRLARIGIAPAVIAVVADVAGVEGIHEAERPVVQREPEHGHVVSVHHAMTKTERLPVRDQVGRLQRHPAQQRDGRLGRVGAFGRVLGDEGVEQPAQRLGLLVVGEVLEVAEADEAGRDPRDDGRGFDPLADHRQPRAADAQGPGRRHTERGHGFRGQELADRRTQHGPAIAAAGVGRQAAALELQLHRPGRGVDLAEPQRAAVAQLAGPDAELMAAVDRRQRPHAGPQRIARKHVQGLGPARPVGRPAQHLGTGRAAGHPVRVGQALGRQFGEEVRAQGREAVGPGEAVERSHRGSLVRRLRPCPAGCFPGGRGSRL